MSPAAAVECMTLLEKGFLRMYNTIVIGESSLDGVYVHELVPHASWTVELEYYEWAWGIWVL